MFGFKQLKADLGKMLFDFTETMRLALTASQTAIEGATGAITKVCPLIVDSIQAVTNAANEIRAQRAAIESHLSYAKHHDEILKKLESRLETTEKRLNGFAFTGIEINALVGELRAMRHLLDERGQYKSLDKPQNTQEIPG